MMGVITVHVWPGLETERHNLECDPYCPCKPTVEKDSGQHLMVVHNVLDRPERKTLWRCGRAEDYPADFSFLACCTLCDFVECVTVVEGGEAIPVVCVLELGWTSQCRFCGGLIVPEIHEEEE